jgi:8-amino-7-oxononanoate synthase
LSALEHLAEELGLLAAAGRLRRRPAALSGAAGLLNLCSNDYLGYLSTGRLRAALRAAADADLPPGAGASRLVAGEHAAHRQLEETIASWLGCEQALLFTSGYAANVGLLSALAGPSDHVVSDALNHASIVDGCRLSRARVTVVPHLDIDAVADALAAAPRARRQWVVTESYFSMDGDAPDLLSLRQVCDARGAGLVVDEAHALGVYGARGSGRCAAAGIRPDVLVGTLGKAAAGQGAFVAGSRVLCDWLWNRARSFVYSTGMSPVLCAVATAAVEAVREDDAGRLALHRNASSLRAGLSAAGLHAGGVGPIVPVVLGSEARALDWSHQLRAAGVMVQAIRPPTVAAGSSRLRLTARADLSRVDLETAGAAFAYVAGRQA